LSESGQDKGNQQDNDGDGDNGHDNGISQGAFNLLLGSGLSFYMVSHLPEHDFQVTALLTGSDGLAVNPGKDARVFR
jgi:hypothetical protein